MKKKQILKNKCAEEKDKINLKKNQKIQPTNGIFSRMFKNEPFQLFFCNMSSLYVRTPEFSQHKYINLSLG